MFCPISKIKEKLRKPCLPYLVSIMILTFSYLDIGQTHLTHLPRHSLVTTSPTFFETLSQYCHWSLSHMAIYRLLLATYHSRKHVTLHMIVIMIMIMIAIIKRISRLMFCVCNL